MASHTACITSLRALLIGAALALSAALALAAVTPGRPVTGATVEARVAALLTPADHLALTEYYRAEARAQAARIDAAERLLRAYMQLEGRLYQPVQDQARRLLRAARESRKRYELLAAAHQTLAFELVDDGGAATTPSPVR